MQNIKHYIFVNNIFYIVMNIVLQPRRVKGVNDIIKFRKKSFFVRQHARNRKKKTMKIKCQQFIMDLINSSLSIKEAEDGIGTLYVSYNIQWGFNSRLGRIIRNGTYRNATYITLVYASIFIPAMVFKSYRIFSATNLLNLVSAQVIHVEWTASINKIKIK